MSGLQIAELPVMAGWLGICPLPGRSGDYRGDLGAVYAWAPDLVLSMTSHGEMAGVADDLPDDMEKIGTAWRHFPVTDFGVPTESEDALWPMLAAELLGWLDRGGRVLLHCKGGCGRSGMVALRLMAEAGEPPKEALARLRKVRPCALETDEQYHWAVEGI